MNGIAPAHRGVYEDKTTARMCYSAVVLALLAAAIHLWVVPEHWLEWPGYGIFFLIVAALQGIMVAAPLLRPRRWVFVAGPLGNLSVVALWVYTRAATVPLGSMAGQAEAVGALDVLCTSAEVALVTLLVTLPRNGRKRRSREKRRQAHRGGVARTA